MSEEVVIKVPGKVEYITTVKMGVGCIASLNGFDVDTVQDIKMAVAEACKCVTCHNKAFWSKDYEVKVTSDDDKLEIIVEDGEEAEALEKGERLCVDCPKEGDLSIKLIGALMDEVSLDKNGSKDRKRIRMIKRRENSDG